MQLLRRALWLFVLVIGLSAGCDDGPVLEDFETRRARCSDDAALTRDELATSAVSPLCEHQVLVASLRPDDPVAVPFRLVTDEEVDYCFEDDNGEAHGAVLFSGDEKRLELTAGDGCVRRHLPPGVYQLHLRHESPGKDDPTPDVVHTRWFPSGASDAGRPSRLLLSTNACPGCDLSGKQWPLLLDETTTIHGESFDRIAGYDGDCTGANFSGSRCDNGVSVACVLGFRAVSSFERARFDGRLHFFAGFGIVIIGRDDGTTSFKGASFHSVRNEIPTPIVLQGDFSGADFTGVHITSLRGNMMTGKFLDADFTGFSVLERLDVVAATLSFGAYQSLIFAQQGRVSFQDDTTIIIRTGDDLSGAVLDGSRDTILWPKDTSTGRPALAGMSFMGAKLTHVNFGCVGGGDLSQTKFTGATLTNVSFFGCDLSGAFFDQATLVDVVAKKALFAKTSMSELRINGLDISEAVLTDVTTLSLASGTVAKKLVAMGATLNVVAKANAFVAIKPDFFHADLTDSKWPNAQFLVDADLVPADLRSTTLDRTDFTGAILEKALFTNATGNATVFTEAHLEQATLDGAHFTGATFDLAHLDKAQFTSGRVCGGTSSGIKLNDANLANTLFPSESNTYTIDGQTFDCHGVDARKETAVTNTGTTCPNGSSGPCLDESSWIPLGATPTCCDPWTDTTCKRKVKDKPCSTSCDCASLKCVASKCG